MTIRLVPVYHVEDGPFCSVLGKKENKNVPQKRIANEHSTRY